MQIHEIIRTRRTALGLTQEQLAGKLGVSAPAVNKWERGNSYPDITLLPVLARTLRVDLNTLLSFREDLTETEIAEFLNRLYEVSRTEGCGAAFSLAEEKLRQFPNSDALAYSAAGLLEGLLTLFPGTDETARPGREDFVAGLYEQAAQSADPKIREWATYTVASRCIARGDLDRAEALLDQISNTHRDKRELLSALRRKQGRTEEAWTLLERELFDRAHGIQTTLLSLIEMAQAEGDRQRAQGFCDAARRAGEALDLSDYAVLSAPFQLAAAEQDYDRFYDDEIRLRRLRRDPPFADHFTLTVTGPEEEPVRRACVQLCAALRQALSQESYRAMEPEVLGPAPAPVVKLNNRYRYRITVVGQNEKPLRQLLAAYMKAFARRPEHRNMAVHTDCNLMD